MHRTELQTLIEYKCPNCNKLHVVKADSIRRWLNKYPTKTRQDYYSRPCDDCKLKDPNYHYISDLKYKLDSIEEQRSVVCGMLLGDGGSAGSATPYTMSIRHCMKQESYALFKRDLLNNITLNTVPIKHISQYLPQYNKQYEAIRINPRRCEVITGIMKELYSDGHKVINEHLLNMLTLQGLAIWYMDDGSCTVCKHGNVPNGGLKVTINTYLPKEENAILVDYFINRWGIHWNNNLSKGKYRLQMGTKEAIGFFNLIRPYIIPEMMYKLPKSRKQLNSEKTGKPYKY